MTDALEALASGACPIIGRPLSEPERELFSKYLLLLTKWQLSQRLIGTSDASWIVENLLLDSLLFLRVLPAGIATLADLGSGAGLPGVPLKIVRPGIDVTLIESRERRASFLRAVVRDLGLDGMRVVNGRAESLVEEGGPRFDAVVMRCAGDPTEMIPLAAQLVAPGGLVVASGPPSPRPLARGEWIEVPGAGRSTTRRFAVYRPVV